MLRAPITAIAAIPFVFGLPIWPWMTHSRSYHLPMDIIETRYKEEIVEPWVRHLRAEGEKSLLGTITASSQVAKSAVSSALEREDLRYKRENDQKNTPIQPGMVQHMVAMQSNLIAAEAALIEIQKRLRECL